MQAMTDILERLRDPYIVLISMAVRLEAADVIERLNGDRNTLIAERNAAYQEIERLRAILALARVELTNVEHSADTVAKIDAVLTIAFACGYLVERARYAASVGIPDFTNSKLLDELADEIETLRAVVLFGGERMAEAEAEIERLREELKATRRIPIRPAGEDISTKAMQEPTDRPRDDGTVVAMGGEPGASAGKSE